MLFIALWSISGLVFSLLSSFIIDGHISRMDIVVALMIGTILGPVIGFILLFHVGNKFVHSLFNK
jgi:putative flippase GtrA